MKKNMGTWDRSLRVALVALSIILIVSGAVKEAWAIFLGVLAAVLILTSLAGFCPLYVPFRMSTKKREKSGE
ncbi:MAG: YgaP family membrane protein [Candidatus Aminicenantales bacterium]